MEATEKLDQLEMRKKRVADPQMIWQDQDFSLKGLARSLENPIMR